MNIQMIFENRITTYDTKADGDAWFTRAELVVISKNKKSNSSNLSGQNSQEYLSVLRLWNRLKYIEQETTTEKRNEEEPSTRSDEGVPEVVHKMITDREITTLPEFCEEWSKQGKEGKRLLRFDVNGETFWTKTMDKD